MEIVIKIPDTVYQGILSANNAPGKWDNTLLGTLCKGVANGTPLPKGHDRLVEARAVIKALFDKKTIDDVPTIIEADKESK